MSPKHSPYDLSVIDQLNKEHPSLAINPYKGLPYYGPNNTILFNGLRRVSGRVYYEGKELGLPAYINARLGQIAQQTDPSMREKAYGTFQQEARALALSMPSINSLRGRVGRYAKAHSVIDISRARKWDEIRGSGKLLGKEDYSEFIQEVASRGGSVAGVGDKIAEGVYGSRNIMKTYFGLGTQEEVRNYATLLDFLPIGRAGGPGEGVSAEVSRTVQGIQIGKGVAAEMLTNAIPSSAGFIPRQNIFNEAHNTSMVVMGEFSSHPSLAGGSFAVRPGSFAGFYTYETKNIAFNPNDLPKGFMDKLVHGSWLSGTDVTTLRAINLEKDADFQALLDQGYTEAEALKQLKNFRPQDQNIVRSVVKEGKQYRLFYGEQKAIEPGRKLSVGLQKGLAAYSPDVLAMANPSSDIVVPWLTKKEVGRQMIPLYEGAALWLMDPKFVTAKERLTNAQRIAEVLNAENIAQGRKSMVRAVGGTVIGQGRFAITPGHVRRVADLLPGDRRAAILNILEGKGEGVQIPMYARVIQQQEHYRTGSFFKAGIQDIAGLGNTGQPLQQRLLAKKIGESPIGNEIRDVIDYIEGRAPIQGETIPPEALKAATSVEMHGDIRGGAGNPLFDPSLPGNRSKRWIADLGGDYEFKVGTKNVKLSQLPVFSLETSRIQAMPGGTIWGNEFERAKINLFRAIATSDQASKGSAIQLAGQGYVDVIGQFAGGKNRVINEEVLKARLSAVRGPMAFLNESQEEIIRKRISRQLFKAGRPQEAVAALKQTGFIAADLRMATTILKQELGRNVGAREAMQIIREGHVVQGGRPPMAPRGYGAGQLVLFDPVLRRHGTFGSKARVAISTGLGSNIHGDLDDDPFNVITEFGGGSDVQAELKNNLKMRQGDYQKARLAAIEKITPTMSPEAYAKAAVGNPMEDVAMALALKGQNTGIAQNAALRVLEGTIARGNIQPGSKYTRDYANKLMTVMSTLGEESISSKNIQGRLDPPDLFNILSDGAVGERAAKLSKVLDPTWLTPFGAEARKTDIARDIIEAYDFTRNSVVRDLQRVNYPGRTTSDVFNALRPDPSKIVPGGISDLFDEAGIIKGVRGVAASNKNYVDAAKEAGPNIGGAVREAVGSYVSGLRQGRGWTSLAIGGAVLAGIGLSMRKPGNITVVSNAQRSGESREDSGRYTKINEPEPVVASRTSHSVRLMPEKSYNVRVKIKEAQRGHNSRFVDLADAMSNRYKRPARANINIRDDSSEQDYAKIFRDEYHRQLRLGS